MEYEFIASQIVNQIMWLNYDIIILRKLQTSLSW